MEDKDQILISKIQATQRYNMYLGLSTKVDKIEFERDYTIEK
jgi:hypothetical protein